MGEITGIMWTLRAINSSCLMLAPFASPCRCLFFSPLLAFALLSPPPPPLSFSRLLQLPPPPSLCHDCLVFTLPCLRAQTVDTNENAASFGPCWSLNNDIIRLKYAPAEPGR